MRPATWVELNWKLFLESRMTLLEMSSVLNHEMESNSPFFGSMSFCRTVPPCLKSKECFLCLPNNQGLWVSEGASTVRNRAMAMFLKLQVGWIQTALIPRRLRSACDGTARCRPSVWLPGGLWWPVELDAKRTCGEVWVGWVFGWAGAPGKLDKCPSKAVGRQGAWKGIPKRSRESQQRRTTSPRMV